MSWGRASSNLRDHCSKRRRHCVMIVLVIVSLQTKNCFFQHENPVLGVKYTKDVRNLRIKIAPPAARLTHPAGMWMADSLGNLQDGHKLTRTRAYTHTYAPHAPHSVNIKSNSRLQTDLGDVGVGRPYRYLRHSETPCRQNHTHGLQNLVLLQPVPCADPTQFQTHHLQLGWMHT